MREIQQCHASPSPPPLWIRGAFLSMPGSWTEVYSGPTLNDLVALINRQPTGVYWQKEVWRISGESKADHNWGLSCLWMSPQVTRVPGWITIELGYFVIVRISKLVYFCLKFQSLITTTCHTKVFIVPSFLREFSISIVNVRVVRYSFKTFLGIISCYLE